MFPIAARRVLLTALVSVFLTACGGRGGPAPAPAGGITVTPGDGQVVVSWTPDPGVTYWLLYAPGTSVSTSNPSAAPGHQWATNGANGVSSPFVLTGLKNGTTYAFSLNGRYDGGPGGPGTPSVSATPRLAGATWQAGGPMGAADMRGVAWGKASDTVSYLVAVGDAGAVYRSSDTVASTGLSWTPVTSGITANLRAAVYGASQFIAVGDAGSIYTSSDTQSWTAATSGTADRLHAVATNNVRFVAVGDNGSIRYSDDGLSWNAAATVPTVNHLYGVSYTGGGWLAVGALGTLLYSSDGSNWAAATSGTNADLYAVTYRGAVFTPAAIAARYVAVGAGGVVLGSTDRLNWTVQTPLSATSLQTVSPVGGQFVAAGAGAAGGVAYTSPDGLVWTPANPAPGSTVYGLANATGQYVGVGPAGASFYSR